MKVNPSIFRAYDIRGIYPQEIDEQTAYKLGQAFVKFLDKKNIIVGRDARLSSPLLKKSLIQGMLNSGARVIDIGLSTSPMMDFAVAHWKCDGGINVTASHNPPQYAGFKLVRRDAMPISINNGLKDIKRLIEEDNFIEKKGKLVKKDILVEYIRFNFRDIGKIKPFKVVIDTANAVAGILIDPIRKKLPLKIYHLFPELDGGFPNHSPDPLVERNLICLKKEVKKRRADLGVAFDGDGDRIVLINEKGKLVRGDLLCAFMAKLILRDNPGQKILYDLRSSNIIKDVVDEKKGSSVKDISVMGRVGHSFIKERMRKENIIFAGELSGHYYHRDHYFSEAPLFIFLKVLEEMSRGQSLSLLIKPFRKYFHSGEINFKVENKKEVLKNLENKFKKGKVLKIDGLRVDFPDWWFNARLSHTEPYLRLVVEADNKELMENKVKELSSLIKGPFSF